MNATRNHEKSPMNRTFTERLEVFARELGFALGSVPGWLWEFVLAMLFQSFTLYFLVTSLFPLR